MSAARALLHAALPLIAAFATAAASAQDAPSPESEESAATSPRVIGMQIGVGAGFGTLGFTRPTATGRLILPDTAFAASEFELRVHARPDLPLSLEALLIYQTSVGLELELEPLFALPERLDVRVQRIELSAAPVVALGSSAHGPALAFPIGFAYRAFSPEVHQYSIDDYQLAGPLVRVELWLPFGSWLGLRLGPEAQWLLLVDSSLTDQGACCQGVALGGQGSLEAQLGSSVRVALSYRQSHGFIASGNNRFNDVERLMTLRIAGVL